MLELLRVRAFAIIDELEAHFAPGFNVLTGETGAGKSILVDALHLVLGGRAQAEAVRTGADEAEVQALFRPRDPAATDARLSSLGLPAAGAELVVRRTVQREGRSRAWVNGALATAAQLSQATCGLLDISGQHEHVGLLDAQTHLSMLDGYAGLSRGEYEAAFAALADAERERARLDSDESARAERASFLRYQLDELEKAEAKPGEDEALAQERRVLAAAEKLRGGAEEAEALLRSGDEAAVVAASRACKRLDELAGIDPALAAVAAAVRGAAAELDEAARTLSRYAGRAGGDPQRLEAIDERLELLRRLSRKHGGSLAAALQRRETMKTELQSLDHHDEALAAAETRVRELSGKALRLGRALSEKRRSAAAGFSRAVAAELASLGMARTEISVRFGPPGDGGIPAEGEMLGPRGLESAELLLSPNPGEELRPLARIASGGELSRVLLAVKRVLADADDVDTYLFDEVDAGIGGATADAVGRALSAVARGRQVICITHLPQIAVFAERHQVAEKEIRRGRTHSRVAAVEGEARVEELARLLSGQATPVALEHARELLEKARTRRPAPARKAG
ncbi:MAG TPA: DNA repair protein RecN [Myxococcales bacterium]|jgi:DNA repair protein RecN (Recombination protein N)|nr:DNA repair protein RecN [Myxococcales bacterium]